MFLMCNILVLEDAKTKERLMMQECSWGNTVVPHTEG